MLDFPLQKFHVVHSRFFLVFVRQCEHFIGHVQAIGFSGRADTLGREQYIDAAARAEVENGFSNVKFRQSRRISAAERSEHCLTWNLPRLFCIVEIGTYWIAAAIVCLRCATARVSAARYSLRRVSVFFFHHVFYIRVRHNLPYLQIWITSRGDTALFRVQHSAYRNCRTSCSASVFAVYRRNVLSRFTRTSPSFLNLSRWCDRVEFGISSSA